MYNILSRASFRLVIVGLSADLYLILAGLLI
nr:MAG TPA: hypothetical protein [Bacteriophage sp.]